MNACVHTLRPRNLCRGAHARRPTALDLVCRVGRVGPQVLMEVLMGKRCELAVAEGAYWRTLSGEQSPSDLDTALQMVHSLFTTDLTPVPAELETCMRCAPNKP